MLIPPWASLVTTDAALQPIERSRIAGDHDAALLALGTPATPAGVQALAAYLTCLGPEHGSLVSRHIGPVLQHHAPAVIHVLTAGARALAPAEALAFLGREAPELLINAFERWHDVLAAAEPAAASERGEVVVALATLYGKRLQEASSGSGTATSHVQSSHVQSSHVQNSHAETVSAASAQPKLLDLVRSEARVLSQAQAQSILSALEALDSTSIALTGEARDARDARDAREVNAQAQAGSSGQAPAVGPKCDLKCAEARALLLARLGRHADALRLLVTAMGVTAMGETGDSLALR